MITAAAFCPHPPMLVPELAAGAALELAPLRAACDTAVGSLLGAGLDEVLVVGSGRTRHAWPTGSTGTFDAYGLDLRVRLGPGCPADEVPIDDLSILLGAWLLGRAAADPVLPVAGFTLPADLPTADCASIGRTLAARSSHHRLGLLVMGDASGRRAIGAPGVPDPDSDRFDEAATVALRSGDPTRLLALDTALADRVGAVGRAPWQLAAGALADRRCAAELGYADAPAEVGYLVATWLTARRHR